MTTLRHALLVCAVLAGTAGTAAPALGQPTVYTWNNTGTDWNTSTNWTPAGPPDNSNIAQFTTLGTFGAAAVNNPTWSSSPATFGKLNLGLSAQTTGWTFASGGTLSLFQVQAFGPVTHTFSGPAIQKQQPAGNGVTFIVGHGTTLAFSGTGTANSDVTGVDLYGGTLRLDNSTTNNPNRFEITLDRFLSHGGTLDFVGHADGSTETISSLRVATGYSRVNVDHRSSTAPTVLNLANGLGRDLRGGVNFTSTGTGTLGAAGNNPRVLIGGQTPGFIAPWAFANGSEYAFYDTTNGVRAAASGAGGDYAQTYTTAIGTNLTQGQYGALDQAAGTPNVTWTGDAGAGTGSYLRIRPGADNQSLTFALSGTNTINLGSIVLSGPRDYTITRDTSNGNTFMRLTGTGGPDHRNVTVLDRNATLAFNVPIAFEFFGDFVKYGDGTLDLTADMSGSPYIGGRADQTNMYINGGVLRVHVGPNGSLTANSGQTVAFRGGVLEIAGGSNLGGAAADFTRPLGTGARAVNWSGSGGFSAFGSDATVNIGGAATPTDLNWNSSIGFVMDGQALTFGSVKSNATLTFENPIGLGGATFNDYSLREIHVTRGAGNLADFTRLTGNISGQATTDLVKTGDGVLELAGVSLFQGNALIQGGTLVVTGELGNPNMNRPANVVVGRGTVLAGTGSVALEFARTVYVNPGGAIRGGTPVTASAAAHTGTLTVADDVTVRSTATDLGSIQLEAHYSGGGTVVASRVVLTEAANGFGNLNLEPGAGNRFAIELVKTDAVTALEGGRQYAFKIASVSPNRNIRLDGSNLPDGIVDPSRYVLRSSAYTFTDYSLAVVTDGVGRHLQLTFTPVPVPEPAAVLGVAAAALGLAACVRRASRA